ncbi:MAG: nucleotide exchange factor GrpE [Firmicutes bacterium]|nr:nucleotide exchange factor GrpE [Bacillota bacterium]
MAENTAKNKSQKKGAGGQKETAFSPETAAGFGQQSPAEEQAEPFAAAEDGADAAEQTAESAADQQEAGGEAAAAAEEQDLQQEIDALNQNMNLLNEEKQELEQQFLRLQADFDNFRRRKARESEEQIKNAAAKLMTSLLPVLDNFQRAVAAMGESPDKEGVSLIHKQLQTVLEQNGLTRIEALGADFDPNIHEAVMQTDAGEENRGKVVMEVQTGYMLNGKLLRASMVQVGS